MSIQSEINRISGNVANALTAIANKGVTVPQGSNSDDLATLIAQISGGGTPAISVVDTADSHGGTVRTITALDISDSTLTTADQLAQGVTAYNKLGVKLTGTGGGGGVATQHVIHLEFDDSTTANINVYYDDSLIGTMITAYQPTGDWTYNNKIVDTAALDNVTWYTRSTETWETLLNGLIHINPGSPYGNMWISDLGDTAIALSSVWRITIDNGTPYIVTATANGIWVSPYNTIIGNPLFAGGTDDGSDVPVCFEQNPWGAWSGNASAALSDDSDHLFKIERQVTV